MRGVEDAVSYQARGDVGATMRPGNQGGRRLHLRAGMERKPLQVLLQRSGTSNGGASRRRPLQSIINPSANLAAQPTALPPTVSGREANPRSAMCKNAAGLVPCRQQPQRILQRIRQTLAPKAAFLWGSTPFLWPRSKKWGGTGPQPREGLQAATQGRARTPSPTKRASGGVPRASRQNETNDL